MTKDEIALREAERISKEEAESELNKQIAKVKKANAIEVMDRADEINAKAASGPLERMIDGIKLLMMMVKDYLDGIYKEVPWTTIASAVAALLYVLSPIDLIPDFIPVLGYIDDAAVVAACLKSVDVDLQQYKLWKMATK